ncbi:MAG: BatA domain-containing protein, partial [Verrucomicrobiota bacterium]
MQPLVFENPLGFGALVGIPALLLIHCLRQQKKRRRVTTLFLLQEIAEDQPTGRQWASLRSSLPLWLQLLSVLLLTIILVGPRWKAADSVKQAAFVLDGTASIRAFLPELRQAIEEEGLALQKRSRTEFVILSTARPTVPLYRGMNAEKMKRALEDWMPTHPDHDRTPSFEIARNSVGPAGTVVFFTDHPLTEELPRRTRFISVGSPLSNIGFSGVAVREITAEPQMAEWEALVTNFSDSPAETSWSLHSSDGSSSPSQRLSLAPRETKALRGPFPEQSPEALLRLEEDPLDVDNVLLAPAALSAKKADCVPHVQSSPPRA